ncbi:14479_t:CDS:2 [Funneliformis mosseae]|uniref:14479_t:CDS:1 n=1 Tax=Funneliformis mosseae TaxID=27381 RepID=A0A9N9ASI7_FUNMO|nr:14479_t:CDS:2 [Funneliformis mosseae]
MNYNILSKVVILKRAINDYENEIKFEDLQIFPIEDYEVFYI